jgi:hypothetical protein
VGDAVGDAVGDGDALGVGIGLGEGDGAAAGETQPQRSSAARMIGLIPAALCNLLAARTGIS